MKIELKDESPELRMVTKLAKLKSSSPTDIVRLAVTFFYQSVLVQEQKKVAEYQKQYSEAEGDEMGSLQGLNK